MICNTLSVYSAVEVFVMVYTLWDIETNNLVAERGDRREALALVMQGIKQNGPPIPTRSRLMSKMIGAR